MPRKHRNNGRRTKRRHERQIARPSVFEVARLAEDVRQTTGIGLSPTPRLVRTPTERRFSPAVPVTRTADKSVKPGKTPLKEALPAVIGPATELSLEETEKKHDKQRPVCKERPTHRTGHGGRSRAFIPWCDKKGHK